MEIPWNRKFVKALCLGMTIFFMNIDVTMYRYLFPNYRCIQKIVNEYFYSVWIFKKKTSVITTLQKGGKH